MENGANIFKVFHENIYLMEQAKGKREDHRIDEYRAFVIVVSRITSAW